MEVETAYAEVTMLETEIERDEQVANLKCAIEGCLFSLRQQPNHVEAKKWLPILRRALIKRRQTLKSHKHH
jgi:hypothetical protein